MAVYMTVFHVVSKMVSYRNNTIVGWVGLDTIYNRKQELSTGNVEHPSSPSA